MAARVEQPVPMEITVGEHRVPAIALRSGGGQPDVDAFFVDLTARVRAGAIVVVDRPVTDYGADRDRGVEALVESVGDCAAVPLAAVAAGEPPPVGLAVAAPAVIRNLCAASPQPPAPEKVTASATVRWTYRAFERLWTHDIVPSDWSRLPPDVGRTRRLHYGIGQRMGELHRIGVVWADAHADNFMMTPDGVFAVDLEDHAQILYRAPTAVRSATDLVPLLAALWPPQWDWLREGYREGRGADAERVIELIERTEPPPVADRDRFLESFPRRRVQDS
jgi:hypothetical protein